MSDTPSKRDNSITIYFSKPDDLFKIGMDNTDFKALGLPEFQGCEGSSNDDSIEKERCVEIKSNSENQSESESENIVNSSNGEIKNSKGQLKVLSLNVCGLVSKSKIPDFVEFVSSYNILCFTET